MDGQRLIAVAVTGELMQCMFRTSAPGHWHRVEDGLPPDAEFVRCYEDQPHNRFVFVYRHPSFPLHSPGELLTFFHPILSALHLSAPLDAPQVACVEKCIAEQCSRAKAPKPRGRVEFKWDEPHTEPGGWTHATGPVEQYVVDNPDAPHIVE